MKLAHLADVHLGFRQYHRLTPQGINQREADVAIAFRCAIDDIIAAQPAVVVFAGDLFHSVRPTNPAILQSFHQVRRLREALPAAPIVIVAGDHDTPRSVETGTILRLFEAVQGVHVVTHETRQLEFSHLNLTIVGVPPAALAGAERVRLSPGRGTGRKVLVVHGEVAGVLPQYATGLGFGGVVVEPSELNADRWDYVALGHYHVAHKVRENAWYSGALEYVSPNPWGELKDEVREGRPAQKGWLLVDLSDAAQVEFRPVTLARRLIDLEPIQGAGEGAETISALIRERVEGIQGGLDHQVVRQVVYNVARPVARDLDHTQIREHKTRALHYHLDLRRPQPIREVGIGTEGTRQTLSNLLAGYLSRRPIDAAVDRARLVALGKAYMAEVEHELLEE